MMQQPPDCEYPFIEVIAEVRYPSSVDTFSAEICIQIDGNQSQVQRSVLQEFHDLIHKAILSKGFTEDQLSDGGGQLSFEWSADRSFCHHSLLLHAKDGQYLQDTLFELEKIPTDKQQRVTTHMRTPRYKEDIDNIMKAQNEAMVKARKKAQHIATLSGVELGTVLQVQEGWKAHEGGIPPQEPGSENEFMQKVTVGFEPSSGQSKRRGLLARNFERTIWVFYRVRYDIKR